MELLDGYGMFMRHLSSVAKGIPDEELNSDDLKPLLLSIRFFKAKYTHMPNQEDFFYEALRPSLNQTLRSMCQNMLDCVYPLRPGARDSRETTAIGLRYGWYF